MGSAAHIAACPTYSLRYRDILVAWCRQIGPMHAFIVELFGQSRFDDLGLRIHAASPADFGKHIADETEKWGKVIRAANIKAE